MTINMNNLFILYETYTDGYKADILDIISTSAILCGIFVIISKNPIVSVLFLIGLFASISCYLIMLGLSFIGLAYLIVYIGAVNPFIIERYYFLSTPCLLVFNYIFKDLFFINNLVSIETDSSFVRCFQVDGGKGSGNVAIRVPTTINLAAPALVSRRLYSTGLDSSSNDFYE
jgi:hypothetical protein